MKTLVTRFVTDESGAILIEHGLAIVVVIVLLVIGLIVRQLNIQLNFLSKMAFTAERRRRRAPSDQILARSCAAIDLLVRSGYKEAQAIHAVTARMLAVDTLSMGKGADVEGWRRIKQWRVNLLDGALKQRALNITSLRGNSKARLPATF